MSRAYRIRLSESLRRHVRVEDGVESKLELLDILPADQTAELLAPELEAAGFEREGEGSTTWRRVDNGVEVHIDTLDRTVRVRANEEADIELTRQREVTTWAESDARARETGRQSLRRELEGAADAHRRELQSELTKKLEGELGDLRGELDRIANKVTAEALKRKAASMGEVQEISEDPETGSLTIRVKI